jgi:hypothetical protein
MIRIFGHRLFGYWLPFIGWKRVYVDDDGAGGLKISDYPYTSGQYYGNPFVLEWLGHAFPVPLPTTLYESKPEGR